MAVEKTRKAPAVAGHTAPMKAGGTGGAGAGAGVEKPKKVKKPKPLTEKDLAKLAMADELGLMEKVKREGWGALTGAESGRLGGLLSRRSRDKRAADAIAPLSAAGSPAQEPPAPERPAPRA